MKLTLPLPPSDNERLIVAWRQRRMILSKKYRDYKTTATSIILEQNPALFTQPLFAPTFENQLPIYIIFYLKDKRRDASDMLKCLLDVMKTLIYTDDKWVVPIFVAPYRIDKENPRVEVEISGGKDYI